MHKQLPAGLIILALSGVVTAQEHCDEATVRKLGALPVSQIAAPDIYFNTRAGKPPVVGAVQMETLRKAHMSERKNQKPYVFAPLQITAATDGSMAYDYGSAHVEFDEAATDHHVSYDITYLRVWKLVDGQCRIAASYSRPPE